MEHYGTSKSYTKNSILEEDVYQKNSTIKSECLAKATPPNKNKFQKKVKIYCLIVIIFCEVNQFFTDLIFKGKETGKKILPKLRVK